MFAKAGSVIPTATNPTKTADLDFSQLTVYFFPDEERTEFDFYNDEGNDLSWRNGRNNIIRFGCDTKEITITTLSDRYDGNYTADIICKVFGERPMCIYVNEAAVAFSYDIDKKQAVFHVVYRIGDSLKIKIN